jgi:hypothetical protein
MFFWVAEFFPGYDLPSLYKSSDASAASPSPSPTWTQIDPTHSVIPARKIQKILIDNTDASKVYVGLAGATEDNLWRTEDGGANWEDITGGSTNCDPDELIGLPCVPIRSIARHPSYSTKIYVGTEIGIFMTDNVDATPVEWRPVMDGPVNVPITELTFIDSTTLLAGTYGRGLWTTEVFASNAINDFDGDGVTDLAVVRTTASPSNALWYEMNSSTGFHDQSWGLHTDRFTPADYDGDGKTDITVFRESDHNWYCLKSSTSTMEVTYSFGDAGDVLVPADFDGDGIDDEAVFRPDDGYWYVNGSDAGYFAYPFGQSGDTPVAADFDGDGIADYAVFRLKDGEWYLYTSKHGSQYVQFGLLIDVPVVGDYDGDHKADIGVWRPSEGMWYITYADDDYQSWVGLQWGLEDDVPVPGDYDGDGRTDLAVWRPDNGNWYIRRSRGGYLSYHFGADGDIPIGRRTYNGLRPGPPSPSRSKFRSEARPVRRTF